LRQHPENFTEQARVPPTPPVGDTMHA
jgi:hypothetical protein